MPSTYLSLHYHIVFSTKHRKPFIINDNKDRFHEYIGGVVRGLNGIPQAVGGVEDHVHLLVGLRATIRLSDFMRELKKATSSWMRDELGADSFAWQEGYSAFTVSPNSRDGVKNYIANQAEHHKSRSFREELVFLLEQAGVEYDAKWLD